MHDDDLYGVQGIEDEVLVWISQKEQQYAPFSLFIFIFLFFPFFIFWWPQWLFLFNSHLSSLGSFDFVLFGFFSSIQGQYSIFYKNIGDLSHFTRYSHKEDITIMMQMYASARIAGYAMILARHVAMIRARPNQHAAYRSSKQHV